MIFGTDIALDTTTREIKLSDGGDLFLVDGRDAIIQHLRQRFQLFLGEFFLNISVGVPYFQFILVKNPNFALVETILRDTALGTPGILTLDRFNFTFTQSTRGLDIELAATSINGTINFSDILEV